jgi:adenylate kinase
MMICIGGISGTGKSSIIKELLLKMHTAGYKTEIIRGLPIMCKLAGGISEDEFRRLPDNIRAQYRPAMQEYIYELDKRDSDTIRIWDGHFAFFEVKGTGYSVRKVRDEDFKQMKLLVVIEATIESILERRKKDYQDRSDRAVDLDVISEQLIIEKVEATKQGEELKIPVVFIENNGILEGAVDKLFKEIKVKLNLDHENNEIKRQTKLPLK